VIFQKRAATLKARQPMLDSLWRGTIGTTRPTALAMFNSTGSIQLHCTVRVRTTECLEGSMGHHSHLQYVTAKIRLHQGLLHPPASAFHFF